MTVPGTCVPFLPGFKEACKTRLSREESIRMHPKRHPVQMDITLMCDRQGMLTGLN
jgi:xanthine dehydrogenase molybdopterin-binding subunit B